MKTKYVTYCMWHDPCHTQGVLIIPSLIHYCFPLKNEIGGSRFQIDRFKRNQPLLYKRTQDLQIKTKIAEIDYRNPLISIHSPTLSKYYV